MQPQTNGHTNGSGQREILRPSNFRAGEWIMLILDSQAQQEPGQFGPQWRYFAKPNTLLYANEKLQAAIAASGARVGDEIGILKQRIGRADDWQVHVISDEPPEARAVTTQWNNAPLPSRRQPAAAPTPTAQPPAPLSSTPASQRTPSDHAMLHCYITAIDLAAHAKRHAAEKHGILIDPQFADIRALAATLLIDQREAGR